MISIDGSFGMSGPGKPRISIASRNSTENLHIQVLVRRGDHPNNNENSSFHFFFSHSQFTRDTILQDRITNNDDTFTQCSSILSSAPTSSEPVAPPSSSSPASPSSSSPSTSKTVSTPQTQISSSTVIPASSSSVVSNSQSTESSIKSLSSESSLSDSTVLQTQTPSVNSATPQTQTPSVISTSSSAGVGNSQSTESSTNTLSNSATHSSALSHPGPIVGIVLGVLVLLGSLLVSLWFLRRRRLHGNQTSVTGM